jgi:hypothetical protein
LPRAGADGLTASTVSKEPESLEDIDLVTKTALHGEEDQNHGLSVSQEELSELEQELLKDSEEVTRNAPLIDVVEESGLDAKAVEDQ